MSASPPPSPTALFKAQLLVKKAALAQKAAKQAKKEQTTGKGVGRGKKAAAKLDKDDSDKENENESSDSISWAKNPKDTSSLLTIIEDSVRYRRAFGFKGGDVAGVTSGGATTAQVCRSVGQELFPSSKLPAEKLGAAVKNRVRSLKKSYTDYHKKLGQTGHGLVMEDRTAEIVSGTPISNVWDKMKTRFPWYKRMHLLLCASPVYDGAALANSATPLDTTVLNIQRSEVRLSPEWDYPAIDHSFDPRFDDDQEKDASEKSSPEPSLVPANPSVSLADHLPISTPAVKAIPPALSRTQSTDLVPVTSSQNRKLADTTATPPNTSRKRKDPFDQIKDLTSGYRESHLETARIRADTKRLKFENQLAVERLKTEESERQRRHELELIDKQIMLARLQAQARQPLIPAQDLNSNFNMGNMDFF